MTNRQYDIRVYAAATAFFLLFLLPFTGRVHLFDWDEIIFAEAAREMMVTGDYLTVRSDFEPFYEKPPLFIWFQVLSMKAFGINEFAARFPNAVCGLVTLLMLYLLGKRLYGRRFGAMWMVTYACALLPFFYFKSGIIDPWFNLFIFGGIALFILYLDPARTGGRYLLITGSAASLGLAVLTKGPAAVLIFTILFVLFLLMRKTRNRITAGHVAIFTLVLAVTGGWWYLAQLLSGHFATVRDFIVYQAGLVTDDFAGHGGFPGYHFIVLLFGVFPSSVVFLGGFTRKREENHLQQIFRLNMYILIALILVLFSIVETKLVHYSSMAYFPVCFLAARVWENWLDRNLEIRPWLRGFLLAMIVIFGLVSLGLPVAGLFSDRLLQEAAPVDPFIAETLTGDVGIRWYTFVPGVIFTVLGVLAFRLIAKRDRRGIPLVYIATLVFAFTAMTAFTPVAGRITQRSFIEFLQARSQDQVHLETLGFKSFAHLFYGEKDMYMHEHGLNKQKLLEGKSERDAYFVIKADKKARFLEEYPRLEVIGEENGYVFTRLKGNPR